MDKIITDIKHYLYKTKTEPLISKKRKIAEDYSNLYQPVAIKKNTTLKDYLHSLLHYFFENFHDKQAFVKKHIHKFLILNQFTKETEDEIKQKQYPEDFSKDDLKIIGSCYDHYREFNNWSTYLDLCLKETKCLTKRPSLHVQYGLGQLIRNVTRCFNIGNIDFNEYINIIKEKDRIKITNLSKEKLWPEIKQEFNRMIQAYFDNENMKYLIQIDANSKKKVNFNENERKKAQESFISSFKELEKDSFYFFDVKNNTEDRIIDYYGYTLLSRQIIIIKMNGNLKDQLNGNHYASWYAFVIMHELCHYHRYKTMNFDIVKFTPPKYDYEAGNYFEREFFGEVLFFNKKSILRIQTNKKTVDEKDNIDKREYLSMDDEIVLKFVIRYYKMISRELTFELSD